MEEGFTSAEPASRHKATIKHLLSVVVIVAAIPLIVFLVLKVQDLLLHASETRGVWGRIANSERQDQLVRGVFFFAGPPNTNFLPYYTRTPLNRNVFAWDNDADIASEFDQMAQANINVIKLSWWGDNGEYQAWAPTLNSQDVNRRTFEEAQKRNIMVAPVLEVSPAFQFWQEYPDSLSNFENRIKQVLTTYNYPNWLKLYDKNGNPRKAIFLIETIHPGNVDPVHFAQTFDVVASDIFQQTGETIGFAIDPTPLPPNGSYNGPDPQALQSVQSLLAINPFNITSDGNTEDERLNGMQSILQRWNSSGIPLIANVVPGYDDHLVRSPPQIYGDNSTWRQRVATIAEQFQTDGISLDIWNGFTEGYAFAPTVEEGQEDYNLAKNLFAYIASLDPTQAASQTTGIPTPTGLSPTELPTVVATPSSVLTLEPSPMLTATVSPTLAPTPITSVSPTLIPSLPPFFSSPTSTPMPLQANAPTVIPTATPMPIAFPTSAPVITILPTAKSFVAAPTAVPTTKVQKTASVFDTLPTPTSFVVPTEQGTAASSHPSVSAGQPVIVPTSAPRSIFEQLFPNTTVVSVEKSNTQPSGFFAPIQNFNSIISNFFVKTFRSIFR